MDAGRPNAAMEVDGRNRRNGCPGTSLREPPEARMERTDGLSVRWAHALRMPAAQPARTAAYGAGHGSGRGWSHEGTLVALVR